MTTIQQSTATTTGKTYCCDLCKKVFNQKIDFTRHTNKKAPCISLTEMQQVVQAKEQTADMKGRLIKVFKACLNILRDNETLIGDKALRVLSALLILKLIEPRLETEIDIDGYDYVFDDIPDENVPYHRKRLLEIVRFSQLSKEKEENLPTYMNYLWKDILSVHPKTERVFLKNRGFDIQRQSTYKNIINQLNTLSECDYDVLGNAYEEVIQDIMTGKVLGQFFTQPMVKKMMVQLVNPQLKPDGTMESCGDPTMGTGGFLITCIQYVLKQGKTRGIEPEWKQIIEEGIYGKELEPDTFQLASSNMLISTGHMFHRLERGDSIREPITRKLDIVLANPPFGIKGLKYDDYNNAIKAEYTPIRTDNAVSLFIQAIIYMLKIGGRCAVVLPDGQDLFSKTNTTLVAIREYLLKTCDLKEIIYLPSGIFTYTSIKTCVFYFVKRREGTDVLNVQVKNAKNSQKETGRDYTFSKTHQTHSVKFYDCNPYENVKNLLVEVPIEAIAKNAYSLNYAEYLEDVKAEVSYEEGTVVKTLGELFRLNGNGKTNSKDITNTGEYPFYKASCNNPSGTHNTFDFDGKEYLLIIKSGGSSSKPISENYGIGKVFVVNGKCAANIAVFQLLPKTNDNFKYLSYYLKSIQNKIQGLAKYCTNNGNIDMKELMELKIPIPPIEKQQAIVEYLDLLYEKAIKNSQAKIAELKQLNEQCLKMQQLLGKNTTKMLGEVCNFKNGKGIKKDTLIEGEYPVIGGGQKPMGFHNEYNADENTILCSSSGAYAGFISKYDKKVWASDCFSIIPKNNSINDTYLYYLLKNIQDKIYKLQTGTAQPHIYSKDLQNIKIPIPSPEKQREIVAYCEANDLLIKQLEQEIENNKKQGQQVISSVVLVSEPDNEDIPVNEIAEVSV